MVLLAESHPAALDLLKELFEDSGCRVVSAATAEECLSLVQAAKPDTVVLSDRLPGGDGAAVCRKIKSDPACQTRVVILTVLDTDEARRSAALAGADACLVKPFSAAELFKQAGV